MAKEMTGDLVDDDYDDDNENDENNDKTTCEVRGSWERIEKKYHDKSKTKIKAEIPYKNGKIDGVLTTYYEDGRPESETAYKKGRENGPKRQYYHGGTLKTETAYQDGRREGSEREYNEKGILVSEIHWGKDGMNGFYLICNYGEITHRYQYTGTGMVYHYISLVTHYRDGELDGMEESYFAGMLTDRKIYKKGIRLRLTSYENGMKHGKEIWGDDSGRPIRVVVYEQGEIISVKGKEVSTLGPEYDYNSYPNGEYKGALTFKNGVYLVHYPFYEGSIDTPGTGGGLALEIPLQRGLAEGEVKQYYETHRKVRTAAYYKAGVKDGIEQNFYPNGALKSEINFKEGEKDGTEKHYPKRLFRLRALSALLGGDSEKPEEILRFRRGVQIGLTEADLFSGEAFEDDDYGDDEDVYGEFD